MDMNDYNKNSETDLNNKNNTAFSNDINCENHINPDSLENTHSNNFNLESINFSHNDNNNNHHHKKKKNHYFLKIKKKAVLQISALILGAVILGNIAGFGIGFYSPKIESFFDKSENTSEISSDDSSEETNPIVNAGKSVVSVVSFSNDRQINPFNPFTEEEDAKTMGSGIIFYQTNKKIYIVTNYHVISNAKSVNISFNNEDYISADLVGKHQLSDIAVISINRESLKNLNIPSVKTAYFGNSDSLNVGDSVIAIGNALGAGNTATKGIVSVIQKDIKISGGNTLSVIQTDAAINMGNDGGALINTNGEVIGINTAKYPYSTVQGVGYSISSNIAKPIIEELMNKTESPYLGVSVSAVTEEIAEENDIPAMGVIVKEVVSKSAADEAGIKVSDIITGFNSDPVFTPAQLTEAVRKCKVGDNVEIKILRNGNKNITLNAVLKKDKQNNF